MRPLLFTLPGSEEFGAQLHPFLFCDIGDLQIHHFPDQECCPRFVTPVVGRDVIFAQLLDRPESKIMPLYLAACVARELGARSVGIVIPYLPYMRQDARFKEGEGETARHFARLISSCCDRLVTVDPHLHRYHQLSELYTVPTKVAFAAPEIAKWIIGNVIRPVIFGPDAESEQWIAEIAEAADCPYVVLNKTRHSSDSNVEVSIPDASFWVGMTPVLIDDIVSTARTMIAATLQIELAGMAPPVCIAVYPLFAGNAFAALQACGVDRIVSCNTIAHATNQINLCQPIAAAVDEALELMRVIPSTAK
ncbi:ribose-phosphate diphosphokinase [Solimicrobium silvestre]|uniref:ribose-phosphate diphosphokinase n=1 Tax=Solimicrobium silvestre TaxID=2099400 RepID=A0A2S9H0N6_9BURK|nr:ribose-phosphate diphosphokinase [Solimicrobium silvestre]PRC93510.1 Ribose-phosphate diphosphokinase [Solimicrobium silvestre]